VAVRPGGYSITPQRVKGAARQRGTIRLMVVLRAKSRDEIRVIRLVFLDQIDYCSALLDLFSTTGAVCMNRRRFLAASSLLALLPASVRAQLNPLGDCPAIFVNGLLQFDPECALTLPGTSSQISPPSHLITPFTEGGGSTVEFTPPKQRRRENAQARLDGNRERQDNRHTRRRTHKTNRHTRDQARDWRRNQRALHCNEFVYRQDAQAAFDRDGYDRVKDPWNLDPDGNGKACESLPIFDECSARFEYRQEAQEFFESSEYNKAKDPLMLDPNGNGVACENLPVRDYCDQFEYREDAQEFFDNSEYDNVNDPQNLDPDNDGKACENLPKKNP
jgi:hypothetical protein